jgi:protein gp37
MAEKTGISWTDSTFNPWIGCTKVGPGCDHCYAEALMDTRWHKVQWGAGKQRQRTSAANWRLPVLWEKEHEAFALMHSRRRRVFCASLADVFDNEAPIEWRDDLWRLIEATPHLDWLLLTKRVGNVQHMVWPRWMQAGFPANVWLGITAVNQAEVDRDIPKLMRLPAAIRWLSMEPLLEQVSLRQHLGEVGPDWVIVGGESGADARALPTLWVRDLRNQCDVFGVPYFFKQWGGKTATAGGCELDGLQVKAWPVTA